MPILLFDGQCNLCNDWVQFILKRDSAGKISFASLQSRIGRQLLEKNKIDIYYTDSLVLIEEENSFVRSDGVLRTLSYLDSWEKRLKYLTIFPKPLRDLVYRFVSNNRYKWFGKRMHCLTPNTELNKRFLSD